MSETKYAGDTRIVTDPITGVERQVFQGTEIPPDLLDAYEEAGGSIADRAPAKSGEVIASKTVTVHDEALGFDRQLIEGQPVPPDLVEAYRAEVGDAQHESAEEPVDEPQRRRSGRKAQDTES